MPGWALDLLVRTDASFSSTPEPRLVGPPARAFPGVCEPSRTGGRGAGWYRPGRRRRGAGAARSAARSGTGRAGARSGTGWAGARSGTGWAGARSGTGGAGARSGTGGAGARSGAGWAGARSGPGGPGPDPGPPPPPPPPPTPASREIQGELRPDRPTIVLTHGLEADAASLWTGFSAIPDAEGAGHILNNLLGARVNVVQFRWEEGLQGFSPSAYRAAFPYTQDAGAVLADLLTERLGPGYQHPIHFIGHSLGAVVNAYAARQFLTVTPGVRPSQFTILDYPSRPPDGTRCASDPGRLLCNLAPRPTG